MDSFFKLVIVSGPQRGMSFPLQKGENGIGRQPGNAVVLSSSRVSKKHCVIQWSSAPFQLKIQDVGSSNGTFVNGALIRSQTLKPKDRISVGEFVLELVEVQSVAPQKLVSDPAAEGLSEGDLGLETALRGPPEDFFGKGLWYFEQKVMPLFYSLIAQYEWRWLLVGLCVLLIFGNLAISISPLLQANHRSLIGEMGHRAQLIARQISEKNSAFLASHLETKTEISSSLQNAEGVRLAVLVDLESRILAPTEKMNQYLGSGSEGRVAVQAKEAFQAGKETGYWVLEEGDLLVAVEPVKVLNPNLGKNIVVAMAVVSIDATLSTLSWGDMGVVYSQSLVLTGLLSVVLFLVFYRLTLKPFEVLNRDLDLALKGEISAVSHEFKLEELNDLWDLMNAAIHRISQANVQGEGASALGSGNTCSIEDFTSSVHLLASLCSFSIVFFDGSQKILFLNSPFEELSGIRSDGAIGQEMSSVARDQSLGVFISDLLGRLSPGKEGLIEDYDFSGVAHKVHAVAIGGGVGVSKGYLIAIKRVEE